MSDNPWQTKEKVPDIENALIGDAYNKAGNITQVEEYARG